MKEKIFKNRSGFRDFVTDHLVDGCKYTLADIMRIWDDLDKPAQKYRIRSDTICQLLIQEVDSRLIRIGKAGGGAGKGHRAHIYQYVADKEMANQPRNGRGFKQFIKDHCVVGQLYTTIKIQEIWDALDNNPAEYYGIARENLRWSLKNSCASVGMVHLGVLDYSHKGSRKPYLYRYDGF